MISRKNRAVMALTGLMLVLGLTSCELRFESDLLKSVRNTIEADEPYPPAAPSDLVASASGVDQIDLTWTDNSDNEAEFQIQRKSAAGPDWQTVKTIGADSTTCSDTALATETEYTYRARAANAAGSSVWSNEASATTGAIPTFSIYYHGNGHDGGTVPVDANEYVAGASATVSGPGTMSRTSYSFTGWNTNSAGTGTGYLAGVTLVMPAADVDLYAQWAANPTYTVTYDGNGSTSGTVPVDGNAYETGETVTVLGNTENLAKTAYIFTGWNTAANGSGSFYAPAQTFAMGTANVRLYAQWERTYTVVYNGNGQTAGTPPVDNNRYAAGSTVTVLGNTGGLLKIDGIGPAYGFDGWRNGSGTEYQAGDHFSMPASDVTLSAIWTPYSIGDVGPAGGIIFYDKGFYSSSPRIPEIVFRYIEAAPSDQSAGIQWGGEGTTTGATDTGIGTGVSNTGMIVSKLGTGTSYAARICDNLALGGFTNWCLPSQSELSLMYTYRAVIGGFATTSFYWSSSEVNSVDARMYVFQLNEARTEMKSFTGRVRAIRYF